MRLREEFEKVERGVLAPYGSLSAATRGRKHGEDVDPSRTAYGIDRDRIVHSNAFRRLEYKTQVFVYHEGDHYRNRLTHSLEVAAVGRRLARTLKLNEDLVESIALAHDLGHSPFGHSGERVLDRLMDAWGGFEHNRQSLRVVEIIEHRHHGYRGMNLSWETREGIAKHTTEYDAPDVNGYGPGRFPSLEAQVACLADEIAYTNHDLDDGLNSGILNLRTLMEVPVWRESYEPLERALPDEGFRRNCYATIRALVGLLISDVVRNTLRNIEDLGIKSSDDARCAERLAVAFSEDVEKEFAQLKNFLYENLYRHYQVRRMAVKAEKILSELFATYVDDHTLLPTNLRVHLDNHATERVICDYLAGMTDRYAIGEYRRLFTPEESL